MIVEFVPIIIWKNNDNLLDTIKSKFDIVDTFTFSFSKKEMKKKLDELYHPIKINDDDIRINSNNFQIIVLKMINPKYMIISRNEHINKPLNNSIIPFKNEIRKQYDYSYFHSSDFLNESQDTFKIFKIKKYIINQNFININDIRGVIWLDKVPNYYCVKKISETPHYLYLNNSKKNYIEYTDKIDKGHNPKDYDSLIMDINSKKICEEKLNEITIDVSYCNDINKYLIVDGFHRTSIYLNNNIHYIKCRVLENNFFNKDKRYIHEHYYNFEQTMNELDINNIRYVIIRGFKKLPLTPDTDLDIICHPEDLNKLTDIMLKRLEIQNKTEIEINSIKVNYIQFKTINIPNNQINNTYFHIDIYDNVFFFYKEHICLSNLLHKLFDNRIKYINKFYIPVPEFEYFLLILRICFDIGELHNKHKNRLTELLPFVKNNNDLYNQ